MPEQWRGLLPTKHFRTSRRGSVILSEQKSKEFLDHMNWFLDSKDDESKDVSELLESELYKHLPYPDQMPGIEEVLVSASLSRGKPKRFHIYPECPALKRCISVMPPLQACQLCVKDHEKKRLQLVEHHLKMTEMGRAIRAETR